MNELEVLKSILNSIEKNSIPICTKLWFKVFTLCFLVLASYLMNAYMDSGGRLLFVILGSSFIGACISKFFFDEQAFKAWLYMKKHIDQESVKNRINEINK